jgi:hypothetical protein
MEERDMTGTWLYARPGNVISSYENVLLSSADC